METDSLRTLETRSQFISACSFCLGKLYPKLEGWKMATKTAYQTHSPTLQHCHVPARPQNYTSPSSLCRAGDQKREHSMHRYQCAPESLCLLCWLWCSLLSADNSCFYLFLPAMHHTPTQSLRCHTAPTATVLPVTASYPASGHTELRDMVCGPGLTVGLDDHSALFQP